MFVVVKLKQTNIADEKPLENRHHTSSVYVENPLLNLPYMKWGKGSPFPTRTHQPLFQIKTKLQPKRTNSSSQLQTIWNILTISSCNVTKGGSFFASAQQNMHINWADDVEWLRRNDNGEKGRKITIQRIHTHTHNKKMMTMRDDDVDGGNKTSNNIKRVEFTY